MPVALGPILGKWTTGGGAPLYTELADAVATAVERGDLHPGDTLPPERALAAELAVSRGTVVAAYALLRERGVVVRRQGSGTRVAAGSTAWSPVARLEQARPSRPVSEDPRALVDLRSATPACAPMVLEEQQRLAADPPVELMVHSGYMPGGLPALREALADLHTREGLPTTAAEVMVTTGAQQAIALVAHLLVRPGDTVLTEDPTYAGALDVFRMLGARVVGVRTDAQGMDVEELERLVLRTRPALIYTVPTYQNPTGTVMPPARRRRLVDIGATHGVPVVEDACISRIHWDADAHHEPLAALAGASHVITVESLSKVFWGGLRMGWVRATPATIARLVRARTTQDQGGPLLEQAWAARLVPRVEEQVELRSTQLAGRYRLLAELLDEHLPSWSHQRPRGGTVVWAQLPDGADASAFAQVALRHGVEIGPGPMMSPTEGWGSFVRLPVTPDERAMRLGMSRLGAAWRAFDPAADRMLSRPLV